MQRFKRPLALVLSGPVVGRGSIFADWNKESIKDNADETTHHLIN